MPTLQETALLVKRLQNQHHRRLDAALADLGVTLVQWDALRHLAENPDASLHDLAQLTFQSDQAFGTLARRMEDRGLVERASGPGRAVRLVMTATGERTLARAAELVDRTLADSVGRLDGPDRAELARLLRLALAEGSATGRHG